MKSPIKRGTFSPYLKVRMDLYNSPDIRQLRHDWVPAEEFDEHAEMIVFRQLQEKGVL